MSGRTLPSIPPRLMTGKEICDYLGYARADSTLHHLKKIGILSPRVPGTNRYDRHAVDVALDKLSGINQASQSTG